MAGAARAQWESDAEIKVQSVGRWRRILTKAFGVGRQTSPPEHSCPQRSPQTKAKCRSGRVQHGGGVSVGVIKQDVLAERWSVNMDRSIRELQPESETITNPTLTQYSALSAVLSRVRLL